MASPKFSGLLFLAVAVAMMSCASANIRLEVYYLVNGTDVISLNNTSGFGTIRVNDNTLRDAPSMDSKIIGSRQGFTVGTSLNGTSVTTNQVFEFTAGSYNGSSVTVVGKESSTGAASETPIAGGTNKFRSARGHVVTTNLPSNSTAAFVKAVLHVLP